MANWCTRRDAARRLGVTTARISQLVRSGRLVADYDAEGRARISLASLDDEVAARECAALQAPLDAARREELARESARMRERALRDRRARDRRLARIEEMLVELVGARDDDG